VVKALRWGWNAVPEEWKGKAKGGSWTAWVVSLSGATASVRMTARNEPSFQVERSPTDFAHGKKGHASPHQNN
jgi:hypothetical protein